MTWILTSDWLSSVLDIKRGQTVLRSSLQPLSLGSPCTNDIRMGRSHMEAVVTRSSRVSATLGNTGLSLVQTGHVT